MFIGYEQGIKAYRPFDLVANRVIAFHDVTFDERAS
jgi:hypothetical protein